MGLFRKNRDPLDNRAKSVRNQLADLQSQIEKLGDSNQPFASQPAPVVHDLKPDDQPLPRRPVDRQPPPLRLWTQKRNATGRFGNASAETFANLRSPTTRSL